MTDPRPDALRGPDAVGLQLVRLRKSTEAVRSRVLAAGGHGLEGSGLAVLYHLVSGGPARVSVLAEHLGLDPSTTSRHVAALERTGHVERVPDPADGRAGLVQASALGRTAFEETRALRNRLIAWALEDWSADEVDAFAAALTRFNDVLAEGDPPSHVWRDGAPSLQETR
ncbi:MarR family winged helix-turn-helix transcriptional regulator [Aquipuribacter sp. SD81]|uniref:MarR family winged helix-turn-helix transcriptional regulator n=1 Tax=Aquipuribacter sp. SD81 TaxID=3127703 RepID=UPI00301969EA